MSITQWLVLAFDYPPLDGGISRLCAEIVRGLARHGRVKVMSQTRTGVGAAVPEVPEERVTGLRPLRELAAWWKLARDREAGPVIAGLWYPEGLLALLAGRAVVVLAHGAELVPPEQRWRRPLWRWLQRWTLERARTVVANSHYTEELVRACAPRATVVAIPLAVDTDRFSPGDQMAARERFGIPAGVRVVSSVARLHRHKGLDVVLRAIASLPPAEQARVLYLVAGRGPALGELQALAGELGIGERVRWLGYVQEEALPDLYRAMDLFALCTREDLDKRAVEGFGLVFLEAQACGTPVVGTRTGGMPDAITEGEGGWLIAQDDAEELRGLVRELVDDPEVFARQGRLARSRVVREATWHHYLSRFSTAIEVGCDG